MEWERLKVAIGARYARPERLSNPDRDFSQEELEALLATPEDELDEYAFMCLFQAYCTAGEYEECAYFIPLAVRYIEMGREGAEDVLDSLLAWMDDNRAELKRDGFWLLLVECLASIVGRVLERFALERVKYDDYSEAFFPIGYEFLETLADPPRVKPNVIGLQILESCFHEHLMRIEAYPTAAWLVYLGTHREVAVFQSLLSARLADAQTRAIACRLIRDKCREEPACADFWEPLLTELRCHVELRPAVCECECEWERLQTVVEGRYGQSERLSDSASNSPRDALGAFLRFFQAECPAETYVERVGFMPYAVRHIEMDWAGANSVLDGLLEWADENRMALERDGLWLPLADSLVKIAGKVFERFEVRRLFFDTCTIDQAPVGYDRLCVLRAATKTIPHEMGRIVLKTLFRERFSRIETFLMAAWLVYLGTHWRTFAFHEMLADFLANAQIRASASQLIRESCRGNATVTNFWAPLLDALPQ